MWSAVKIVDRVWQTRRKKRANMGNGESWRPGLTDPKEKGTHMSNRNIFWTLQVSRGLNNVKTMRISDFDDLKIWGN